MRRVDRVTRPGLVPRLPDLTSGIRDLRAGTVWITESGQQFDAVCLDCPDRPCGRYSMSELLADLRIVVPLAPDSSVCPTDAIVHSDEELPSIDASSCTSCGLCAIRCPVGAIRLSQGSTIVNMDSRNTLVRSARDHTEHVTNRTAISNYLLNESSVDTDLLMFQMQRLRTQYRSGTSALRLLTRNSLMLSGARVRLANPGDHNSVAECVADHPIADHTYLFEIEVGNDVLDTIRRLLAAVAIASGRFGLPRPSITPVVVLTDLPNKRGDYYEVIKDIDERLNITIRTITAAVLLAQIQSPAAELLSRLQRGFKASSRGISLPEDVHELYGIVSGYRKLGLLPTK